MKVSPKEPKVITVNDKMQHGYRYALTAPAGKNFHPDFKPQLTKYPMLRLDPGEVFVNPHFMWHYDKNFASDRFLGILHFKFLPDFPKKMDRAIKEANYWRNSFEYQRYNSVLSGGGDLTFMGGDTEVYKGPASLVRCNLISPISW